MSSFFYSFSLWILLFFIRIIELIFFEQLFRRRLLFLYSISPVKRYVLFFFWLFEIVFCFWSLQLYCFVGNNEVCTVFFHFFPACLLGCAYTRSNLVYGPLMFLVWFITNNKIFSLFLHIYWLFGYIILVVVVYL